MGVLDRKGTLERGKDADIIALRQRLECESRMGNGAISGRYQ